MGTTKRNSSGLADGDFARNDPAVLHAYDADNVANELTAATRQQAVAIRLVLLSNSPCQTVVNRQSICGEHNRARRILGCYRSRNARRSRARSQQRSGRYQRDDQRHELHRATAVLFNGTSASFTVNSQTAITAAWPAGATTGRSASPRPGHGPSASSFYPLPAALHLHVNKASPLGIGNGTVTSTSSPDSPTQIKLRAACSATYDSGTTVTSR